MYTYGKVAKKFNVTPTSFWKRATGRVKTVGHASGGARKPKVLAKGKYFLH